MKFSNMKQLRQNCTLAEKKKIFNFDLKTETLGLDRISSGRLFQRNGPETGKARSPSSYSWSLAQEEGPDHRRASNTL